MTNPDDTSFPIFDQDGARSNCAGLTKRELFSAMMMKGLVSCELSDYTTVQDAAKGAVEIADALIKALNA